MQQLHNDAFEMEFKSQWVPEDPEVLERLLPQGWKLVR